MKYNLLKIVKEEVWKFEHFKDRDILFKEEFIYKENKEVFAIFQKCILRFVIDEYEQISTSFYEINSDKKNSLNNVMLFNIDGFRRYYFLREQNVFEPFEELDLVDCFNMPLCEEQVRESLRNDLKIISKYLMHVINGDFTWVDNHNEFTRKRKFISKKLNEIFIYNHESFKKLVKGDPDWEKELPK